MSLFLQFQIWDTEIQFYVLQWAVPQMCLVPCICLYSLVVIDSAHCCLLGSKWCVKLKFSSSECWHCQKIPRYRHRGLLMCRILIFHQKHFSEAMVRVFQCKYIRKRKQSINIITCRMHHFNLLVYYAIQEAYLAVQIILFWRLSCFHSPQLHTRKRRVLSKYNDLTFYNAHLKIKLSCLDFSHAEKRFM